MTIVAAADGSALGNPGPTGWAWFVDEGCWRAGGFAHGTNNIGELSAVLDLLQQTAATDEALHIICDSTYVINTITKWMAGWKRKGWRKGDGKPVLNLEIIKALDEAMVGREVSFEWVKGHTGHPLNEAADQRANAAAQAFKSGTPLATGPGFAAGGEHPPLAEQPSLWDDDSTVPERDEDQVAAAALDLLEAWGRGGRSDPADLLHGDWSGIDHMGHLRRSDALTEPPWPDCDDLSPEVIRVERISANVMFVVARLRGDRECLVSSWWQSGRDGRWRAKFLQVTARS